MSNGMRSAIVSIAEIVSSMFSLLKARIRENVEPHHSPAARDVTGSGSGPGLSLDLFVHADDAGKEKRTRNFFRFAYSLTPITSRSAGRLKCGFQSERSRDLWLPSFRAVGCPAIHAFPQRFDLGLCRVQPFNPVSADSFFLLIGSPLRDRPKELGAIRR